MSAHRQRSFPTRHGAAFLMLVVMVLLVVVGATATLVTSEVSARRGEVARSRAKSMHAAIDAALKADLPTDDAIRFPVNESLDQSIEVTFDDDQVQARWLAADKVLDQVTRDLDRDQNSEPSP